MGVRKLSSILFGLSLSVAYIYLANAQSQSCSPITINDLGSTTSFSIDGLVADGIVPPGESNVDIPVRIMNHTIVCDASGDRRDTSSYVSVVVQFQCNFQSTTSTLMVCDGNTTVTRQYQFQCIDQNGQPVWAARVGGDTFFVQTLDPTATLSTPLANQCRRCIDDQQSLTNTNINDTTHCDPCGSGCNQGQRRCFIGSEGDECCNFYLEGGCVAECPSGLVNDSNFDCVCPDLSLENGYVTYSSTNRDVGSMATHTCNTGYRLSPQGGETRTCTSNSWDGQDVTCELIVCPDLTIANGRVTINPPGRRLGSMTIYECVDGFALVGDGNRVCQEDDSWSGEAPKCNERCGGCGPGTCIDEKCQCPTGFVGEHCSHNCSQALLDPNCEECGFDSNNNPICTKCKVGFKDNNGKCESEVTPGASSSSCDTGCIIGIVLAILGAIILSIVVALVVYAVYRYLSNPATKLAKTGTEGLNGVARDNPLYLAPEKIVGDVGDVETA